MEKFYKDNNNIWFLGCRTIPAGSCNIIWMDNDDIRIVQSSNEDIEYFKGNISELCKEDGTPYETIENLLLSVASFFKKPSTLVGEIITGVTSVAGKTGDVTLNKSDVGLPLANNTPDLLKPVSLDLQLAIDESISLHLLDLNNKHISPTYLLELTGGENTDIHTHYHNNLDGISGGLVDDYLHITSNQVSLINNSVLKLGDQQVDGVKEFIKSPLVPIPISPNDAVNLKYVEDKILYISKSRVFVNNTNETSLYSNNYRGSGTTIKANTLKDGDMLLIKNNGYFSTSTNNSSIFKMMFGNTLLFQLNVSYTNNKSNFLVELEVLLTIRKAGSQGILIAQGKAAMQRDTLYNYDINPLVMLSEIPIDTTIDNKIDILFKWGQTGPSITISNSLIEIL